ncbi:MAG: hypothetical protein ABJC09_01225 [Terriglobia bacterium]
MTGGLKEVVAQLERQSAAIDKALTALRELDGASAAEPAAENPAGRPAKGRKRKSRMSPEGRARLIAALKRRWASKKASAA